MINETNGKPNKSFFRSTTRFSLQDTDIYPWRWRCFCLKLLKAKTIFSVLFLNEFVEKTRF